MKLQKAFGIVFCTIVLILIHSICLADSSSLNRTAETVQMIDNDNVRMAAEDVYIKAYSGYAMVSCEFIFKNETNAGQQVLMGFPASLFGIEGDREIDESTRLSEFKAFIDGRFELSADISDPARDLISFNVFAYTELSEYLDTLFINIAANPQDLQRYRLLEFCLQNGFGTFKRNALL